MNPQQPDILPDASVRADWRAFDTAGPNGRIPLRLYRPASDGRLPLVIYLHGGGFVSGSLDDADAAAHFIAAELPAVVLSVGYALAPAHPFPAAPEDAYAATLWAVDNAASLGADPERLVVAGDDAGGNLAASLALMARDRQDFRIAVQVLIGPMLDPSMTRTGDARRLQSDLSVAECTDCYRQYLPRLSQRLHPYAAPLESCRQAGLPAAYIATAEHDLLHCEAEKYGAALIAAGVHTQVERFAGVTHAGLLAHAPVLAGAVQFMRCRLGRCASASPALNSPSTLA
ncbi:alpha/beta hydrolase fold family protein [Methyloversatilis sp. RAC08]|uniref:alpha/beta hydrolase n=1 Tax=Methyloversatilis sp. RAC08 TaxID=1842540 RepID=UPI000855BDF9|nr:alpha/beta hydrolase [Methyloversatilis sp. RAC08]AOF81224.1 alpha/beta hydrolase fold family protein [Methyloversatilis sp. RAC08]